MQNLLVIAAVVAAGSYLVYLFYSRFIAKNKKCDGCALGHKEEKDVGK